MDLGSNFMVWLHEWQTLAGALTALIAAGVGWRAINRQMQQSERQEGERVLRAYDAARAVLPLTLDQIGSYARKCADYAVRVLATNPGASIEQTSVEPPELPQLAVEEVRRLIEVCPQPALRKRLGMLIAELQVQQARMTDSHDSIRPDSTTLVTRHNIIGQCLDALSVNAQAMTLFSFARFESDEFFDTISWDDLVQSSGFLLLYKPGDEVLAELKRRKAAGLTPTITGV